MITLRLPAHFPVRATEWMLAAMMLSWGTVLLVPFSEPIFGAPYFAAMRDIAPQETWGVVGLLAGVFHLAALWINGTYQKSPHWRALCSGVGVVFWLMVCIGIMRPGHPSTGWAIYPWLALFSLYNVGRGMVDARLSDDRARGLIGGGK